MSLWTWIAVAAFSWVGMSLLVAIIVARVLGIIGREGSHLLEAEADAWFRATYGRVRGSQLSAGHRTAGRSGAATQQRANRRLTAA
jgi:hypothetical protein